MPSRTSIQRAYESILSDHVRPLLAAQGFKKSGPNFRRRWNGGWHVINFQKSQWGDRDNITFTFNVGVNFDAFDRFEGRDPARAPTEPYCPWRSRPGEFYTNPPEDDWWRLDNNSDTNKVAIEVVNLIRSAVLPMLARMSSSNDILRALRHRKDRHGFLLHDKELLRCLLLTDSPPRFRQSLAHLRKRAAYHGQNREWWNEAIPRLERLAAPRARKTSPA